MRTSRILPAVLAALLSACGGQATPEPNTAPAKADNNADKKPAESQPVVELNAAPPPAAALPAKGAAERSAQGEAEGPGDEGLSADGNAWGNARGEAGSDNTIASGAPGGAMIGNAAADSAKDGVADAKNPSAAEARKPIPGSNPIPVAANDPSLGKATALVTIVEFGDLQCPFCRKAAFTINELRKQYGDNLRFVWKNNPLAFHKEARPAAEVAMALLQKGGNSAFWNYYNSIFNTPDTFTSDVYENALKNTQVPKSEIEKLLQSGGPARKVDDDIALAKQIGVDATPVFFINGVMLRGAQSAEKFKEIIDRELPKAKELLNAGIPQNQIYDVASRKNFVQPSAKAPSAGPSNPVDDKTTYVVPIGNSPVKGKATALITLVVFSDFQCPFCIRVENTLSQLETRYGEKLRIVFKNNPLPFHKRAEPAAQLVLEAQAQKGSAGFWKVHDALFSANGKIDDSDLENIAKAAGLNVKTAMAAIAGHKHQKHIEADQDLAEDLEARGTPAFFINGRRLSGAQPIEKFEAIINEELTRAEGLLKQGTQAAKVYETLQKQATPPKGPPLINVPAPGKDSPSKGPNNAKITIQVFSDFQCPFCKKVEPTLDEVLKAYPNQVRIVWRNMPLTSIHAKADLAAEAAMEVFRQKGADAFWKIHDKIFADQQNNGLERNQLEAFASDLGADMAQLKTALDQGTQKAAIERDKKIAEGAGVKSTPTIIVNGYLISGAQPFEKFRKVINRALKDGTPAKK